MENNAYELMKERINELANQKGYRVVDVLKQANISELTEEIGLIEIVKISKILEVEIIDLFTK